MISIRQAVSITIISFLLIGAASNVYAAGTFEAGINWAILSGTGVWGLSSLSIDVIVLNIVNFLVNLVGSLALLGIVLGGTLYVVSAGNEQRNAQAKRIISFSLMGLFIVGVRTLLTATIAGWLGTGAATDPLVIVIINRIISFLQAIIGIISTLLLIVGGILYMTSIGDDQKTTKAKQTIFAALAGLLVTLIASPLTVAVVGIAGAGAAAGPLRNVIVNTISYILAFTAIIAVAAFIVGGFTYLTSGGNDEKLQRGKKIIIYTVIGIVVIMLSAAITNIVITL